jgi:hypothetical protein
VQHDLWLDANKLCATNLSREIFFIGPSEQLSLSSLGKQPAAFAPGDS